MAGSHVAVPARRRVEELVGLAAPFAVAAAGGLATAPAIGGWYRTLRKPDWNPPDVVFGPVWTTLYALMAAAYLLARRSRPADDRAIAAPYALQLALNLAWSLVFFGARSPRAALVVIVLLWGSIVATIASFGRARRLAAALLVPYLAWVTFAAILNAEIVRLNPE